MLNPRRRAWTLVRPDAPAFPEKSDEVIAQVSTLKPIPHARQDDSTHRRGFRHALAEGLAASSKAGRARRAGSYG